MNIVVSVAIDSINMYRVPVPYWISLETQMV